MEIRYKGCSDTQANFGRGDDPRKYLTVGQTYKLLRTDIHSWHTLYYLEGFEDKGFNSVCFE